MNAPPGLRALVAIGVLSASGAVLSGCRRDAPSPGGAPGVDAQDGGDAGAPVRASALAGEDAGAAPERAGEARGDGGAIHPACEGRELALLAAAVDPRCAAPRHARAADGGADASRARSIRQEVRREGERIVVSLVNDGTEVATVPLRFHPGHPELAFSVLAEVEGQGVFELAAPANDAPREAPRAPGPAAPRHPAERALLELDAGPRFERVHTALIRIAPGGAARARLVVDPRVVKRLDRRCPDGSAARVKQGDGGAPCLPARLPPGHVALYVGQLVAPDVGGEPARVDWDLP